MCSVPQNITPLLSLYDLGSHVHDTATTGCMHITHAHCIPSTHTHTWVMSWLCPENHISQCAKLGFSIPAWPYTSWTLPPALACMATTCMACRHAPGRGTKLKLFDRCENIYAVVCWMGSPRNTHCWCHTDKNCRQHLLVNIVPFFKHAKVERYFPSKKKQSWCSIFLALWVSEECLPSLVPRQCLLKWRAWKMRRKWAKPTSWMRRRCTSSIRLPSAIAIIPQASNFLYWARRPHARQQRTPTLQHKENRMVIENVPTSSR